MNPHLSRTSRRLLQGLAALTALTAMHASAGPSRSYTGSAITENFDGLGPSGTSVTALTGWDAGHFNPVISGGTTGGNASATVTDPLVVDNGTHDNQSTAMLANFGSTGAADRALGSFVRTSPNGDQFLQLAIKNDTANPITSFVLAYTGEQWQSGNTAVQALAVWYSGTSATSGFTSMGSSFTFNSPNLTNTGNAGIDGNASGNRTAISATFTPTTPIPAGGTFYIRWYDVNDSGTDDYLAIDDVTVTPAVSAPAEYVIIISVDGLGGTYLKKIFDGTATGGPYAIPNFTRLKNEGASTLAGHCDNNNWETLPNHTSIITARPRDGTAGHNWTGNGDPAVGQTIHSNKGSYVASGFDVAHDNGLVTAMYANKSKFSLFDNTATYPGGGSYNATYGALDITGADNGRDKIDNTYINTTLGGIVVDTFIAQQTASPNRFAFLHINEPDANGHGSGWGSATWNASVVTVDGMLGKIFKLIETDVPAMTGKTAIILTADHGNQDNPPTGADRYQVPFYVWGPGVPAGADLYTLNSSTRQVAASYPMTTYTGMQPIRNAEASNLALDLLGLGPIPGSSFDFAQDLVVSGGAPPTEPTVTLGLAGSPMAEAAGVATVTATLSATHTLPVTVNLAYTGTATPTTDYTASADSIVIAAGDTTGTVILTAVQDAVSDPAETIVVDIVSVDNATESGTQTVTATITDDDAPAVGGFTAYNDCTDSAGNPANTTLYRGNATTSGFLKDFATGTTLPVTLTITASGLSGYAGGGGPIPNADTDCYNVFNGKVVFDNVAYYGTYMEARFTGLDPNKEYEVVTSANRGRVDYTTRTTQFSISDIDSATQAGTAGVTVNSPTSVTFLTGYNTVNGYVARWTNIKCGADGDFTLRNDNGAGISNGYSMDGIMLKETDGTPPTGPSVTLGLAGSPLAEDGGTATVTATLSETYTEPVTVNLAYAGTATPTTDYTASADSIVIAAGDTTGSVTLTAVQDAFSDPAETIVVDISTVTNGNESGIQQVTAIITDDDPVPLTGIAFGPTGTGPLAFDALPANSEWSTVSMAGGGATVVDLTGMDGFVNGFAASGIADPLGTVTADPAGTTTVLGQWNSTNLRLTDRAGTTAATCFMTTLRNDSGVAVDVLDLSFTLTGSGADPELPGYVLYYSLTGNTGDWVRIGNFGTLGPVTSTIPLTSSWADGATLYVLWMDDNANGAGDNWYGIDDVNIAPYTPAANILTFDFGVYGPATISGTDISIFVPSGTDVSALSPTYTLSPGATCDPLSPPATPLDFTSPVHYIVQASDFATSGTSTDYTVTVVALDPTGKIYVNMDISARTGMAGPAGDSGATWNERIGTTAGLSASGLLDSVGFPSSVGYTTTGFDGLDPWGTPPLVVLTAGIRQFNNGANNSQSLTINGLTPGAFYNVWLCDANCLNTNQRSNGVWSTPNPTATPGAHACSDVLNNVGNTWIEGTTYVYFVKVEADVDGKIVFNGYSIPVASYDVRFPLNAFQIEPYTPSTNCDMLTFGIPDYAGVIDQDAMTITLDVPAGTVLETLAPTFTTSPAATCDQPSGAVPTPDFSAGPVHYIVTADDGVTQKDYTVTVNVLTVSTACDMLTFSGVPGAAGVIDQGTLTIAFTVPYGTDLATLAPTYTTSLLATCDQPNGVVPTPDFSAGPVHYVVTAQDGTTQKDYTATVTVGPAPPGGVTGVALWLDASQLAVLSDGAPVTTWNDMSGLGNHATADGAPIYKTGVLNGQPVIRFDDNSKFTTADLSSQFPTAATGFIVTTINSDNNYTLVKANPGVDEWWRYDNGQSYPGFFRGNRLEVYCAMPNSGSHVFAISSSASAWEMSIDGASQGVAGGNYNAGGAPLIIGNGSTGGGLNGDIAEVLLYDRVLSPGEASAVGMYLSAKYGLTTAYLPALILTLGGSIPGATSVIDQNLKTIALSVPYGTDLATLAPTYTLTTGTCDQPNDGVTPPSPTFADAPGNTVTYTVIDGTTTNAYAVTVTVASPISFGPTGTGTLAFDELPNAIQWSTVSVGTSSGAVTDDTTMDAAMASVTASSINTALVAQADNTVQNLAIYRSDLGLVETQVEGGNTMTLLMATLRNDSGGTVDSLTVSYTMGLLSVTPGEQVAGHRVYWSKDGTTWTAVADYAPTVPGTTIPVSFDLTSLAWGSGELLYVVWADDNTPGGTGPEGDYTIDDISFAPSAPAFRWTGAGDGNWTDVTNWNNTVPGAADIAILSDSDTAGATATLDADAAVAGLTFNNLVANQLIDSPTDKTLTLASGASLTVDAGSHSISANVDITSGKKLGIGTVDLSGTVAVHGTGIAMFVSDGVLGISGTTTFDPASRMRVDGSGTLEVTGVLNTAGTLFPVGSGASTATATVILKGSGQWNQTHSGGGDVVIGISGTNNGRLIIQDTAQLNSAFMVLGFFGPGTGTVQQDGGTVTLVTTTADYTALARPALWIGVTGPGDYHLNGGTLTCGTIGGTGKLYFNSGTLVANMNDLIIEDPSGALSTAVGQDSFMQGLNQVVVQSGAVIDTAGHIITIAQNLEHDIDGPAIDGGLTKQGLGTLKLLGTNTYTGPTKVEGGVLACELNDALGGGALEVETGATLQLDYSGTKQVASLKLGGVVMGNGTYGSDDPSGLITGTGTVTVGGLTGYAGWAAIYAGGQAANLDYNNDGVQNGIAYFMGENGLATNPGVVDGKVRWKKAVNDAYAVKVSTNLIDWGDAPGGSVTEEVTGDGTYVVFTLPTTGPKLFVRLEVTIP